MFCLPITVNETDELDILYEGLHAVMSEALKSAAFYSRQIPKMEKEYDDFLNSFQTDVNESLLDTEFSASEARRKEMTRMRSEIKRKRLVLREIEKKITLLHRMFKRMSDPRPTADQLEEYQDRQKRSSIAEMMKNLQDKQSQPAIQKAVAGGGNGPGTT